MISDRVLLVDDDPAMLASLKRSFRNVLVVDAVTSGDQALEALDRRGPFAVVVSDMRMPGMNGAEFLARARAAHPDTVRIMLTGNVDQETAVRAINTGDVFRFLNKPCPQKDIGQAILEGINLYRVSRTENDLLQTTLRGSVDLFVQTLSRANPKAFGRTMRHVRRIRDLGLLLGLTPLWELEVLASLSQVGCVLLAPELQSKAWTVEPLTQEEHLEFSLHPELGARLVKDVPRLEEIARAIRYQEKHFDGSGFPADDVTGADIPLGARLLKALFDLERLESAGDEAPELVAALEARAERYDPTVLRAVEELVEMERDREIVRVSVDKVVPGMILAQDVLHVRGALIASKGQEITESVRDHMLSFHRHQAVTGDIRVSLAISAEALAERREHREVRSVDG